MKKTNSMGYTAIELIGVLLVIIFLILATNKYIDSMAQARLVNQLTDEAKNYSYQAIKYIEDNYRVLVQQSSTQGEVILAWSSLSGYATSGNSGIINNYQTPCLYISSGMPNTIKAYIIFGNTGGQSTILNGQTIGRIAQGLGGNAGDLVNNNGNYVISGYLENEYNLTMATVNNIIQVCSFVAPLPKDMLIIDLSKDISMFASIKGEIDINSTANESDPTLKKSATTAGVNPLTTMETNLYLDNVVKESTLNTSYYCDATELPVTDANSICLNTASSQSINMYPGTATWVSSLIDSSGQNCIATANAHFYSISYGYSCSSVNFPSASSFCPATYNGQPQVGGSGYWSPQPATLSGASCIANAAVQYQNNTCMNISCANGMVPGCSYSNGQCVGGYHSMSGCMNTGTGIYAKCAFGQYISGATATGTYSNNQCNYIIRCGSQGSKADPWTDSSGYGVISGGTITQSCGQKSLPANTTSQTNDLGFKNC